MVNIKYVCNIVRKDILEAKGEQGIIVSVLVIPFIFSILLPLLVIVGGTNNTLVNFIGGIHIFIEQLPNDIFPINISKNNAIIYAVLMYFFIPFFLLIPVIVSTILSTSSFTGEREKKTIEGLLYTPITNKELMLGKILSSFLPAIIVTWISITVFGVIINLFSINTMEKLVFPNLNWIIIGGLIAPLITFLSISLVIAISHKMKTSKSAQSVSMLLILPIIGFLISQASGLFLFGTKISLILVSVLIVLDFSRWCKL